MQTQVLMILEITMLSKWAGKVVVCILASSFFVGMSYAGFSTTPTGGGDSGWSCPLCTTGGPLLQKIATNTNDMLSIDGTLFNDYFGMPLPTSGFKLTQFDNRNQASNVSAQLQNAPATNGLLSMQTNPILADFIQNGNYSPLDNAAYCMPGSDTWIVATNDKKQRYYLQPKFQIGSQFNCLNISGYKQNKMDYANNAAFRFNSLINEDKYETSAKSPAVNPAALSFIAFASGLMTHLNIKPFLIKKIDANNNSERSQFSNKLGNNTAYVAKLRTYMARLSVGLNNLYHIYVENYANIPNKAKQGGKAIIPSAGKFVSRNQILSYLATERLRNPNFGTALLKAGPAALERQSVEEQAVQTWELDQIRQSLARLNAAMSTMQLEVLDQQKVRMNSGQP